MHESRHQYWFHVMLLSSHIGGALLRIHVAPTRPDLAANPNLCFTSRPSLLKVASWRSLPGGLLQAPQQDISQSCAFIHTHTIPCRRTFLSRARDPGHRLAGKRTRQAAEEVEAVGDYLDSRCSDFSDEGEDALCAYQGEGKAEAEAEAADRAWRRGASPAAAYGGGRGVWSLWPTTSETTHVEPGVRPRREKAMAANGPKISAGGRKPRAPAKPTKAAAAAAGLVEAGVMEEEDMAAAAATAGVTAPRAPSLRLRGVDNGSPARAVDEGATGTAEAEAARARATAVTKPAAETTTAEAKGAGEAAEDTEQEEQARPSTLLSVLAEAAGVMQAR